MAETIRTYTEGMDLLPLGGTDVISDQDLRDLIHSLYFKKVVNLTTSRALNLDDSNAVIEHTTSATLILSLPSTLPNGFECLVDNRGTLVTSTITFNPTGGSTLTGVTGIAPGAAPVRLLHVAGGIWKALATTEDTSARTIAASYSLSSADANHLLLLNSASAATLTLSDIGSCRVYIHNIGAGTWTISGQTTLTGGSTSLTTGRGGWLEKLAANNWKFDSTDLVSADLQTVKGGATISDARLRELVISESIVFTSVVSNDDGVIISGNVVYMDGSSSAGTYAASDYDDVLGVYDVHTFTHTLSSKTVTITITTRNAYGTPLNPSVVVS